MQGNAGALHGALQRALADFCGALLRLLTSDRSVAINRGAVHLAETGEMAATLRAHGRDAVLKDLLALMEAAVEAGVLRSAGPTQAQVLVALAVRDWQIDRLLGRMPAPSDRRIAARAREAAALFFRLYGRS
jgi:hypothetical protein